MILSLYSIYDKVAKEYAAPFCGRTDEEVMRSLRYQLSRPADNPMRDYPDDFDLYKLGDFDSSSGVVQVLPVLRFICHLSGLVPPSEPSSQDTLIL